MITFFNFGHANHLALVRVVSDDDYAQTVCRWLSGRLFGYYISLTIPSRW